MFKSITTKLIALILAAVIPMVLVISYTSYKYASSLIMKKTKQQAELLLKNTEYRINMRITPIEKIPAGLAANLPDTQKDLEALMLRVLYNNPDAYGMAAAFEPHTFAPDKVRYAPYVFYDKGVIKLTHLDSAKYNYPQSDWYKRPKLTHIPVWSEPYFDTGGGNALMSTYSYPIYKKSRFYGVTTVDVTLDDLAEVIRSIRVLKSGYAFLISADGMVMVHPDKAIVMKENILNDHRPEFAPIADMIREHFRESAEKSYETATDMIWCSRISSTGWYVGVVFPKSELFAPVRSLNATLLSVSIAGCFVILLLIVFISRRVTVGIKGLSASAERIAGGDLQTAVHLNGDRDEVGRLSQAFESMRTSLINYIENLRKTEGEKQKIESELSIAREIQMSILPKTFPPFPERHDIDIYASMRPAKEVGGDLYDFYFLDDKKLCFLVGDVSGKGVPASLFMAVAKTFIKAVAETESSPGEVFTRVNRELAVGNDSCMFVTVFMGVLDIAAGTLTYANAGHNPPAMISGRGVRLIENYEGDDSVIHPPLGAFADVEYPTFSMEMKVGEKLFLYTDGVTEAMNVNRELYSEKRLVDLLLDNTAKTPEKTIKTVLLAVDDFAGEVEQHDDITMLCLLLKQHI